MSRKKGLNRRKFLKNSAVGMVGAGMLGPAKLLGFQEKEETTASPKIKEYRTLGRTGFKVSDISTGSPQNEAILNALLDAGVNYIDTAEAYGQSQRRIGEVLKNRGDRKKIFISTKLHVKKGETRESVLKRARKCLEHLQTDYIDCLMIHSLDTVEAVKSEGFHAATMQLKNEGRLRFVGLSNHGVSGVQVYPQSMEKTCLAAAEDGRFDVMFLAYNFLNENKGEKVIEVCGKKNIGPRAGSQI